MIKKQNSRRQSKIIFTTGALFFLVGMVGMIYNLWINPTSSATTFLPQETVFFAELKLDSASVQNFNDLGVSEVLDKVVSQNLPAVTLNDFSDWVGEKISLAVLPQKKLVFAAKYRNKNLAKKFIDKFLLPEETWQEKVVENSRILVPSYSSKLAFAFKDNWLIVASDLPTLQKIMTTKDENSLQNFAKYQKTVGDFPRNYNARLFLNIKKLADLEVGDFSIKKPFVKSLTTTMPFWGMNFQTTAAGVAVKSKILTVKGVFSEKLLAQTPNEVVPELSKYAPQDVLFFMNGYDLAGKYEHTKEFLNSLHPELSLVFEGVLRAKFKQIFGENFDFQKNFLNRLRGQYALTFNLIDEENPFVYFSLITGFGDGTVDKNMAEMQELIQNAQQNYSTKIEEHSLPDGSVREELVLADLDEVKVTEKVANSHKYFTAESVAENGEAVPAQLFSYGFIDNLLVFSNHEQGIKDAINAYDKNMNLNNNNDFRDSVLVDFPISESYGFLNVNKLNVLLNTMPKSSLIGEWGSAFYNIFKSFRNMTFARKTFPEEVFFSATLKNR